MPVPYKYTFSTHYDYTFNVQSLNFRVHGIRILYSITSKPIDDLTDRYISSNNNLFRSPAFHEKPYALVPWMAIIQLYVLLFQRHVLWKRFLHHSCWHYRDPDRNVSSTCFFRCRSLLLLLLLLLHMWHKLFSLAIVPRNKRAEKKKKKTNKK